MQNAQRYYVYLLSIDNQKTREQQYDTQAKAFVAAGQLSEEFGGRPIYLVDVDEGPEDNGLVVMIDWDTAD